MLTISAILYFLFTRLYPLVVGAAAAFSRKARKWLRGRFRWQKKARRLLAASPKKAVPRLWMHCASLGEFEQGRPVLEAFKAKHPEAQVLLTFFSPSGYEIRKKEALADWVAYLPMDSRRHARQLLDLFAPTLVVFVKYEFWWYYLREIKRRRIPLFLIAARFRPGQLFFKPSGKWHRRMLQAFTAIMVQDERSEQLLRQIGLTAVHRCGDPRIDRVLALARESRQLKTLERFTDAGRIPLLVIGSSWPADEKILVPWLNNHLPKGWKVLLAPHEIRESHLRKLIARMELPVQRYTHLAEAPLSEGTRILVLDTVGLLSRAYRYGRIAYIGGGFGRGIHNILEPAAFGLPVLFGPRYKKFEEAVYWVKKGAAFPVSSAQELAQKFEYLQQQEHLAKAQRELKLYLQQHEGAAGCCLAKMEEYAG